MLNKSHRFIYSGFLILGVIATLIGGFWLFAWYEGWAGDWSAHGAAAGIIIMKTNTALGLFLSGLTILLIGLKEDNLAVQILATPIASLVFIIGILSLNEHLLQIDLGIDQLLATEMPGAAGTASPNRMGLIAATCLSLIGSGLLFMIWNKRLIASSLGAIVCIINLLPAIGYILKIGIFFSLPKLTGIAWPTIIGLFATGLGLIFSARNQGLISKLFTDDPGGVLLRRLITGIFLVPLVLGTLIIKGVHLEIYDQITGFGIYIISTIILLLVLALLTARALSKSYTERKIIEDEINSIAKFPSENPYPVMRLNKDGYVQYSNDAALEIIKKWNTYVNGQVPAHIKSLVREIVSKDESGTFEIECNDKIFSLNVVPVAGESYINLYGADVTLRRKAENAVRISEEKYRTIVELSQEGIVIASPEGKFLFINKRFADMLGYTIEDIMSRPSSDFFYDDEDKISVSEVRTRLKQGDTIQRDMKFRCRDGSPLWTLYNATPLFDSAGKHYGNLAMHTDITERKSIEDALKRSEERLRIAIESGNVGVWEWDIKKNLMFADERTEKMFGLEPGTFDQTYDSFEKLLNEEDISRVQKSIKDAIEKNLPFETLFRITLKNGNTRYISSKGHLQKDNQGQGSRLSGICSDITELVESNEKLISKINAELLRSNRELENFAYVASHDLQEPLRMVTSFTQLLAQQYKDKLDDKALEYIDFAVEGSKRMYELLNGLLTYSRISTRSNEFNEVDLGWVYDSAIKNLTLLINERQVSIRADKLPVVSGDANQLTQLFQNLIANSIKFSVDTPVIHITAKDNHDHYLISVKDNGIGIESKYYEKIFQIFQRLNPRDKFDGTGIGLSICKRIVERHDGKIWLESTPGKGTTFYFTLPKNLK